MATLAPLVLLLAPALALAAEQQPVSIDIRPGGSSPQLRVGAAASIPLEQLNAVDRQKVQAVLADACFFRRLPTCSFCCHPQMYSYLVDHPDILVNIWQLLGITQLKVHEIEPGSFRVVDAAGTRLVVRCLWHSHKMHLFYSEGTYDGPLFLQPVNGRGVMILVSGYVREPDGRYYVTSRLDVFMAVDRATAEVLTRTFQPLLGKVADFNFTQTMAFVAKLWQTTEEKPLGVQRLADRLSGVRPSVREKFADLAVELTTQRHRSSETSAAEKPEQLAERSEQSVSR